MFFSSLFYPFSLSRMYVADLVFCRLYTCYYIIKRFFSPFFCFIPFPLLLFSSTNRLPLVFYLCKLLTSELHQCNYINTPPALIKHRRHTYLSNYIVRIERRVLHHQSRRVAQGFRSKLCTKRQESTTRTRAWLIHTSCHVQQEQLHFEYSLIHE